MTEVEYVSVVNLNDEVVGSLPRSAVKQGGVNYRVIHVLLRDSGGRLLLQRPAAALGKSFQLGSSVAGHVRAGESYVEAARREYSEELGLTPKDLEYLGTTWLDEKDARKFIGVFLGTEARPLRPDPSEVDRVEALDIEQVVRLMRDPSAVSSTFRRVFSFAEPYLRGGLAAERA